MTDHHFTVSIAHHGNILYPVFAAHTGTHRVAEDTDEYNNPHHPVRLSCAALETCIRQRLENRKELPTRLHALFDDLVLLLRQREEIDVFDLLVEIILLADQEPALHLSALLAVLDDAAVANLESNTIARTGAFIHDVLQQDIVRWYLQHYHEIQEEQRK